MSDSAVVVLMLLAAFGAGLLLGLLVRVDRLLMLPKPPPRPPSHCPGCGRLEAPHETEPCPGCGFPF